jgi:predicted permease
VLSELASIVLPVYCAAGVGFLWVRSGRPYDTVLMTELILWIGTPCLTFAKLTTVGLEVDRLFEMMAAVLVATASLALIAATVLKGLGLPWRTYLAPSVFGNTGNMGIPICYFAFGDEGLVLGVCFFAATAFLQFATGPWIWHGEFKPLDPLRSPVVLATCIAVAVVWSQAPVPLVIERATDLLGSFTIPIMQLTLGVSLARLKVARFGMPLLISALKMGGGALVGFGVAELLGLEGVARGVLVLDCTMPVAVFNYMFATKYEREPGQVASTVVLSTLLSFVTLPLVLAFLIQ